MSLKHTLYIFYISAICCFFITSCQNKNTTGDPVIMPSRGLCAHRGAMETHPENTLPAFHAALESGAHMIEFDVQLTSDNKIVVIHDYTVDRTTNGTGRITDFTFEAIRKLDAGGWKSPGFSNTKIPTLNEVLEIMPVNIWLNIHIKGDDIMGSLVALELEKQGRLHQAFLACSAGAARMARESVPEVLICNMDRRERNIDYVKGTIDMKADFIQLRGAIYPGFAGYAKKLKENGISINYFGTDDLDELKTLFDYGVDFPLVDDIVGTAALLPEIGIEPANPVYR